MRVPMLVRKSQQQTPSLNGRADTPTKCCMQKTERLTHWEARKAGAPTVTFTERKKKNQKPQNVKGRDLTGSNYLYPLSVMSK